VVQPRAGLRPEPEVLETHARRSLAAYKVPRAMVLVDAVRRSPSGKPDYRWARDEAVRLLG
jgi:acyl-CoA synthetase (AMP-forming)/AMP-acid ligase II